MLVSWLFPTGENGEVKGIVSGTRGPDTTRPLPVFRYPFFNWFATAWVALATASGSPR
jgi:hypothetical protein